MVPWLEAKPVGGSTGPRPHAAIATAPSAIVAARARQTRFAPMAKVTSGSLSYWAKFGIAFLAPLALALAFPKTNWWPLSLVSLAPLFWLWSNASWKSAFWWGWLSGTVYFGLMLNWVPNSLGDFIGAWTILALVLLAAWQGLAFAAAAILVSFIQRRGFGFGALCV